MVVLVVSVVDEIIPAVAMQKSAMARAAEAALLLKSPRKMMAPALQPEPAVSRARRASLPNL
jgi:hypothetical protein